MHWYHRVSVPWLEARRDVLTATDVVKLLPEWKRIKKNGIDPGKVYPMFASVWCEKNTTTEPDPASIGAAARGHIMEPYAVESYNRHHGEELFFHWDDCIIKNNGLGFSPDAMDIRQDIDDVQCNAIDGKLVYDKYRLRGPESILEIKSYSPGQHMKSIIKDKMDHDELMQIAVAFAVLPKLELAKLMFYCPDAPIPVIVYDYKREDLSEQIEQACSVASMYAAHANKLDRLANELPRIEPVASDAEVWQMEMNENPGEIRVR